MDLQIEWLSILARISKKSLQRIPSETKKIWILANYEDSS